MGQLLATLRRKFSMSAGNLLVDFLSSNSATPVNDPKSALETSNVFSTYMCRSSNKTVREVWK